MSTEPHGRNCRHRSAVACAIASLPFAAALVWAAAASGATLCTEPVTPFCANQPTVFESDMDRGRCRAEVEKFAEAMRAYAQCLEDQQRNALERAEEIEERYRCMAAGGEECR